MVERLETVPAVEVERALRGAENRDPPVSGMRELDKGGDDTVDRVRRPDRVARDDRHAADDLVREQGPLVFAREVRLVGPQDERGEGVGSPCADEFVRELAIKGLLLELVAPGRQPAEEQHTGGRKAEEENREWEPLAEVAGQVRRATNGETKEGRRRLLEREAGCERLVGHQPVRPERHSAVCVDGRGEGDGADDDAGIASGIAPQPKSVSRRDQSQRDEYGRSGAVVDAVDEVEGG